MRSTEFERVMNRMLAPPVIRPEPGFTASLLIAPGESQLYDPLFMRDHGGAVWIMDDGGQEEDRAGQILAIDKQGKVSEVVALGRLISLYGFDIAPESFTPYRGHIFTVSSTEAGSRGISKGHIVQRVDPATRKEAETFCILPPAGGKDGKDLPAWGGDARFGPEDSVFAGRLFAISAFNGTVYQVASDGKCTPFVTLDIQTWGRPVALAFSPDGEYMLVSTYQGEGSPGKVTIARVSSEGTIEPLVRSSARLNTWGMAYAPADFGEYAGQLFIAANDERFSLQGNYRSDTMPEAGEIYRLTPDGQLKLVASGFRMAIGVHFVGNRLWVSDANGDFLGLGREFPDGFVVEISTTPEQ